MSKDDEHRPSQFIERVCAYQAQMASIDRGRLHPEDSHLLDDWSLYEPRSDDIYQRVHRLAHRGVRVEAIETAMVAMLDDWIARLPATDPQARPE